jgi:hypothetical protein
VLSDRADSEGDEQTQISIYIWAANGSVGHTAIRIEDVVYGYYPTDINGDRRYTKEDLKHSPGEMHIQCTKEFTEHYRGNVVKEFVLNVSPKQLSDLRMALDAITASPGMYELTGNNCTSVAIYCLKQANINVTYSYGRNENCYPIPIYSRAPWHFQAYLESPCNSNLINSSKVYTIGQ